MVTAAVTAAPIAAKVLSVNLRSTLSLKSQLTEPGSAAG
jgi:hypothetical protein